MTQADKNNGGPSHGLWERMAKEPRLTARIALGALLLVNVAAATIVVHPWGGSPEDLQRQLASLRRQVQLQEASTARLRQVADTVEKTREGADQFFDTYFLDRPTAYSTVLGELTSMADKAGVKARDHSFGYEPIEGSDTMAMMIVTGNYEGTYANLVQFIGLIDRSPRFLTIERLQASPLQSQGTLAINLRLNVFVRGDGATR